MTTIVVAIAIVRQIRHEELLLSQCKRVDIFNFHQISRFEAKDSCLTEGNEDDTITYCYSSTELAKVNPRHPLASSSSQSTSQKAVDNALCVVKTNAVFERDFFESVGSMSSAVFSTSEGTTEYDYIETASTTSAYVSNLNSAYI